MDCRQLKDPSEIEAWKTMLDSMIKFINASTKLMDTYNQRASNQNPAICVPECPIAQKSAMKQCSANVSQKRSSVAKETTRKDADETPTITEKRSSVAKETTKNDVDVPPTITEKRSSVAKETTRNDAELPPTITEPTDVPDSDNPQESVTAENEEGSPTESPEIQAENQVPPTETPEEEPKAVEEVENAGEDEIIVEAPEEKRSSIVEEKRKSEVLPTTTTPEQSSRAAEGAKNAGGDICVCKEVRQVKHEAKESVGGKCGCGTKKSSRPQLCACPVTSKETADLTESMVQKLEKAQEEIDGLKNELQKLQFMESTRKSNSAALYKEIMKETSVDPGPPYRSSTPMRRTAAPTTVSNPSQPLYYCTQTRRPPSALIPPPIRSDPRSYTQSGFGRPPVAASTPKNNQRASAMMQPLAASTFIGDVTPINSAPRWPQQIPNRQPTDLTSQSLNTSYYIDEPTQSETSQRWKEDCYCPEDDSRFQQAASSVQPHVQYSEVECVYRRPKNATQDTRSSRTSPQAAPEFHPANQNQMRGLQGMMQAAFVCGPCAPPRTYAQPPVYQSPRYAYENEDQYEDQLCDDYSCENDECENR